MQARRAFTIIEILTAVAVIAILSTLVVLGVQRQQQSSRDSSRKAEVGVLAAAEQLYGAYKGTYFISANSGCATPSASNANCTGVNGTSQGQMNFTGTTQGGLQYSSTSIVQVLKNDGYLTGSTVDVQHTNSSGDQLDYVLVLCTTGGAQSTGFINNGFAVWAKLENTIDANEADYINSSHYCGGSTSNSDVAQRYHFGYTTEEADNTIFPSPEFGVTTPTFEENHAYYSLGDGAFASDGTTIVGPSPSPTNSGSSSGSGSSGSGSSSSGSGSSSGGGCTPTPSPSPSISLDPTPSGKPTAIATSLGDQATPCTSSSPSPSPSITCLTGTLPVCDPTPTPTPTNSPTPTPSPTHTPSPSFTPSPSGTPTPFPLYGYLLLGGRP